MSKGMKLTVGDEQFSAYRELAKIINCPDPETAAYAIERFGFEYYRNDETPLMSLSLAKKTFEEMGGNIDFTDELREG